MGDVQDRLARMRAVIAENPRQARHDMTDLASAVDNAVRAGEAGRKEWLDLAQCFFDLSEYTAAIETMERVLRTYGADPIVSLHILKSVRQRGNVNDIPELPQRLKALMEILPQTKESLPELVRLLRNVDEGEVIPYEDKWTRADPDNPHVWLDVAHRSLYMAQHPWTNVKRPPGYAETMTKRARQHLKGAVRAMQGPHAKDAGLWNRLGQMQDRAGMVSEAAESARNFFRLDPHHHQAMLGILKLYPKFPAIAASDDIDRIIVGLFAREGEPAAYWRDLALLCGAAGRAAEKRAALERCLALDPNDLLARQFLRNPANVHADGQTVAPHPQGESEDAGATRRKHGWWRRLFAGQPDRG